MAPARPPLSSGERGAAHVARGGTRWRVARGEARRGPGVDLAERRELGRDARGVVVLRADLSAEHVFRLAPVALAGARLARDDALACVPAPRGHALGLEHV